jgi:hypothetical protein
VHVLDHEDERIRGRDRLQKASPRREGLLAVGRLSLLTQSDERLEARSDPVPLALIVHDGGDRKRELRGSLLRPIVLEDAGVGLHDLAERPERDALAVRKAAPLPPVDEVGKVVDESLELPDEPALADSRLADDGDELHGCISLHPAEEISQQV